MKIYGDMANGEGFACLDKEPLETKGGNKSSPDKEPLETKGGNKSSPWIQGFLHSSVQKPRGQR